MKYRTCFFLFLNIFNGNLFFQSQINKTNRGGLTLIFSDTLLIKKGGERAPPDQYSQEISTER